MNALEDFTDLKGIDQNRAEHAAEWLVWSARSLGQARANRDHAEKLLKVAEKQAFLASDKKTVAEREADAISSEHYQERLEDWSQAHANFEILKATADAAGTLIDTWRSINSAQKGARV